MKKIQTLSSLTKKQREAVGLLSIGTFLEYFDLMLYVHMAVLLNELFFPKTDPNTASLLSAFAFCSTFVFRPFGALLFGWLGDNISRKATVILTTFLMAFSCVLMANLPTYSQVGIAASWLITLCRIMQGMSSVGEIVGAELYLTEITKPPIQYPLVSFIAIFSVIGTVAALAIASIFTAFGLNWRIAFWMGAAIATVGGMARTTLRETPEFFNAKRLLHKKREENSTVKNYSTFKGKANKKTILALLLINCAWPACFYFAYIHCANILKISFGYSSESIIHQNFIVSLIQLCGLLFISFLSYKIYPLKIIKMKLLIFSIGILFCPYLLNNSSTEVSLFLIQVFIVLFAVDTVPAVAIFFKHFPVLKRFTYSSLIYAISRALMYVVTSFGIIFLTKNFGHYGLLVILIPINIGCIFGINHFESLEKQAGAYPKKLLPTKVAPPGVIP